MMLDLLLEILSLVVLQFLLTVFTVVAMLKLFKGNQFFEDIKKEPRELGLLVGVIYVSGLLALFIEFPYNLGFGCFAPIWYLLVQWYWT